MDFKTWQAAQIFSLRAAYEDYQAEMDAPESWLDFCWIVYVDEMELTENGN